jgi:transposase
LVETLKLVESRREVTMPHSPRYTAEFKAEAVRLAKSGERSIPKTAADLGIATDSLRAWIKQAQLDAGERHDGPTSDDQEELRRLRREVRVLREEREILKKAAAFFAKETDGTR